MSISMAMAEAAFDAQVKLTTRLYAAFPGLGAVLGTAKVCLRVQGLKGGLSSFWRCTAPEAARSWYLLWP